MIRSLAADGQRRLSRKTLGAGALALGLSVAGCNMLLGNEAPSRVDDDAGSGGNDADAGDGADGATGGSDSGGGACSQGQTRCSGNGLQTCSDGEYGTAVPCENQTCLGPAGSASCQGECTATLVACFGNGVQVCGASGEYDGDITACTSATPQCAGGVCDSPPSCQSLTANCGSSKSESCCRSLIVTGGEYDRINDESYPATVADFRLDKYEVTVGRWRQFVEAWSAADNPWRPKPAAGKHAHLNGGKGLTSSYIDGGYEKGWDTLWADNVDISDIAREAEGTYATWTVSSGGNENRPINYVNWYEAYAFCIWDGGFLPSEAEWNYAAAGGDLQREYPWAPPDAPDCARANFLGAGGAECHADTHTWNVGGLPNGNGRYEQSDLAGNLSEWNLDWADATDTAFAAGCDNCAYLPNSSDIRVFRGGAFNDTASSLLSSSRGANTPDSRGNNIGLRCARAP